MDNLSNQESSIFKLEIDEPIKGTFVEMSRWTKFLAIIGFIQIGLLVFGGFFFAAVISNLPYGSSGLGALAGMGAAGMVMFFIIVAALLFYPVYALIKYSITVKRAMITNNKEEFYVAINWLKNMFKYQGILMIIGMSLYAISIIFAILGAMMR